MWCRASYAVSERRRSVHRTLLSWGQLEGTEQLGRSHGHVLEPVPEVDPQSALVASGLTACNAADDDDSTTRPPRRELANHCASPGHER